MVHGLYKNIVTNTPTNPGGKSSPFSFFAQSSAYLSVIQALGQGTGFWCVRERAGEPAGQLLCIQTSRLRERFFDWPLAGLWETVSRKLFPCVEAKQGPVGLEDGTLPLQDAITLIRSADIKSKGLHGWQ